MAKRVFILILKAIKWLVLAIVATFIFVLFMHYKYPISMQKVQDSSKVVLSSNGKWLYTSLNKQQKWRFRANLKNIDPLYIKMLLAFEDKRYYKHFGVDFISLNRALLQYIKHKRVVSGGSTITMQLAKLLEPKERTIRSKIIEILRAFELELFYTKEQILQSYLSLTPYGGNIEGVVAASLRYFGKLPSSLSANQAAILVAFPQRPELNRLNLKRLKDAKNRVLLTAKEKGIISTFVYKQAIKSKSLISYYPFPKYLPHLSLKLIKKDKLQIQTTIDYKIQKQLERWAYDRGKSLEKGASIAALIVKNSTSEIIGYLGSYYIFSNKTQGFIDMVDAYRSPGSALKPFIYALGFKKHIIAPLTIIKDTKTNFQGYLPHNFNNRFLGEVTIAYALQHSLNIPAIKVLQRVGVQDFTDMLNSVVEIKIPKKQASLPVALGGLGINLMGLSTLYSALANDGVGKRVYYLKNQKTKSFKILDRNSARAVSSILRANRAPNGFINLDIAYKTGTSYGFRDYWCAAYTKDYTVVVWVGKPNAQPMLKSSALKVAAPMAFEILGIVNSLKPTKKWDFKISTYLKKPPKALQYFDKDAVDNNSLKFIKPKQDARYKSTNCKDVVVDIEVTNATKPIYWYIDSKAINSSKTKLQYKFNTGAHTITAIDNTSKIISRDIWVDKPNCRE